MAQIFLLFFLLKNPPQSERRPVSDAARPSTPLWKNIFAQFCHHSPKQEDTRTVGVTVLFFFLFVFSETGFTECCRKAAD